MSERKTPRTDAEAYELEGEYVVGYNAAKQLEIETQELAEALERIARIGETQLVHIHPAYGEAPHEVAIIARAVLAAHKARQP